MSFAFVPAVPRAERLRRLGQSRHFKAMLGISVVSDNLSLISNLTDAVSNTVNGTTILHDAPLYHPFDTDATAWWDNLVAEELQNRLPAIMFASRGTLTANSTGRDAER
jgi:Domain of unknown function (DUF5010)